MVKRQDPIATALCDLKDGLVRVLDAARKELNDDSSRNYALERCTFVFLVITTIAVIAQGWIFYVTMIDSRDAAKSSQRGYLSLAGGFGSDNKTPKNKVIAYPKVGWPVQGWVAIENTGMTPVGNVRIAMVTTVLPFPEDKTFGFPLETLFPPTMLGSHYITYVSKQSVMKLTQTDIDKINTGQSAIYVYGTVYYADIYKEEHFTEFCLYFTVPDLSATDCEGHHAFN